MENHSFNIHIEIDFGENFQRIYYVTLNLNTILPTVPGTIHRQLVKFIGKFSSEIQ